MKNLLKEIRHVVSRAYKSLDRNIVSKLLILEKTLYSKISDIISEMNNQIDYVICKWENRLDPKFPLAFSIPTEIDVLTHMNDVKQCADFVEHCIRKHFDKRYKISILSNEEDRIGVILYFHHRELFYFDVQTAAQFALSTAFNENCLAMRQLSANGMSPPPAIRYDNSSFGVC